MRSKKDSYVRIRISSNEKAELKNFVESKGTTLTATLTTYLKTLLDSKVNSSFV